MKAIIVTGLKGVKWVLFSTAVSVPEYHTPTLGLIATHACFLEIEVE